MFKSGPFRKNRTVSAEPVDNIIIWVFSKIGVPQNGWFIMENRIKMDDLGAHPIKMDDLGGPPLFLETPI